MVTPAAGAGAPLSLRAYGRHRKARGLPGGNAVAVSRAIATQRLSASVVTVDGIAKITDPALADAEWAANTDHSRAPGDVKEQTGVTPAAVTAPVTVESDTSTRGRARPSALAEASTREKNARANIAELDYRTKAGELVSAAAVEAAWSEMAAQMRAAVLSVPSKAKSLMPHTSHADLAQWNELLCQALEALADRSATSRSTGTAA